MSLQHFAKAQKMHIASLGITDINAYLQDLVSSQHPSSPIACGFFRMERGKPLEYSYGYDECKIMLEGEMTIQESGGAAVQVKPGDVLFFSKGTKVTFSSESSGLAFYCGQRKEGQL
jgi:ethanolamine utilization protein EutQ (cupin superfamily)